MQIERALSWPLAVGALWFVGCHCESGSQPNQNAGPAATSPQDTRTAGQRPRVETLLEMNESAYGATLHLEGDDILLLTRTALYRISADEAAQRTPLPLAAGHTLIGSSVIYHSEGAFRAVSLAGGEPRVFAHSAPPRRLSGSETHLFWTHRGERGKTQLLASSGGPPQLLTEASSEISALAADGDGVFFAESGPRGHRLGRVTTSGAAPETSTWLPGRPPSMLLATPEGLLHYEGPKRSVLRWAPDLSDFEVITESVVCSPMAVGAGVACARVGGIDLVARDRGLPVELAVETQGPATTLALDDHRLVWVVDTGEDRLAIRSVDLKGMADRARP